MDQLLTPAFLVDSGTIVKSVPTNGEEFLQNVIAERGKYPELVVADTPYSTKQNYFIEEPPAAANAPPTLKPTIEWQTVQISDFYNMRINVIRLSLENPKLPRVVDVLPLKADSAAWKEFFRTQPPTLRVMLAMRQVHLDKCLEIILEMLDEMAPEQGIEKCIGEWIYAILIRQSNPVLSDTSCLLRNLARKCAEIRSHLSVGDEEAIELATPLNLFICIVARYFRELDLADNPAL